VLCSRAAFCALSRWGRVPAVVSPRMSRMLDNLRIHREFMVILLLPLGLLAALAAGRIRSDATQGVPAGRVNTLAIWR
jgi:hypothetical protein